MNGGEYYNAYKVKRINVNLFLDIYAIDKSVNMINITQGTECPVTLRLQS